MTSELKGLNLILTRLGRVILFLLNRNLSFVGYFHPLKLSAAAPMLEVLFHQLLMAALCVEQESLWPLIQANMDDPRLTQGLR
jgi:hypothetical protein